MFLIYYLFNIKVNCVLIGSIAYIHCNYLIILTVLSIVKNELFLYYYYTSISIKNVKLIMMMNQVNQSLIAVLLPLFS